jgi:aspartate carbamoyltransferase catalytic subunit
VATTITMKHSSHSQPLAAAAAGGTALPQDVAWKRRHLLGLEGLSAGELRLLLQRVHRYAAIANRPETRTGELEGRQIGTMFFEDSTRTRSSFTLAARRHSAEVIDLSGSGTSVNKGETLVDTARTLEAMGVSALVVRTKQSGGAELVARAVGGADGGAPGCCVLNAGDGRHEHPTQGLLDLYTIAESHGRLEGFDCSGLTVAIVGDVASSRVARSAIAGLRTLGARVMAVGSPALAPGALTALGCEVSHDFDGVLPDADVVMMLRIQFERHSEGATPQTPPTEGKKSAAITSIREYRALYGMTRERAARLKPGAVIMHPGPMNRGLEIDAEVADGPRSIILRQVARGVAARMAALAVCVEACG